MIFLSFILQTTTSYASDTKTTPLRQVNIMEVDQACYRKQLLSILKHIANASFVSFDLEMSGIYKKSHNNTSTQKLSLQQLYEETRTAAETFQVLQVGITCVEEDREKGKSSVIVSLPGGSLHATCRPKAYTAYAQSSISPDHSISISVHCST